MVEGRRGVTDGHASFFVWMEPLYRFLYTYLCYNLMMLGGMMGPITLEAAVMAAAKLSSKPSSFMACISISPKPAASAAAEPEMPANTILASTFT